MLRLLVILALLPLGSAGEAAGPLEKRLAEVNRGRLSPIERCALVDDSVRGNGDPTAVMLAALSTLATDRCRHVREYAIDSIQARLPGRLDALAVTMATKPASAARAGAAYAVMKARGWAALDLLGSLAADQGAGAIPVRLAVATALATFAQEPSPKAAARATAMAATLAADKDLRVRLAAIAALAKLHTCAEAQRALENLLLDPVEEVARQALEALLATGADTDRMTTACIRGLRNSNETREQIALVNALGRLGGTTAAGALIDTLLAVRENASLSELKAAICDALGQIASDDPAIIKRCEAVLPTLAVRERWAGSRMAAIYALLRMGSPLAIPAAIEALPRQGDDDLLWLLQQQTGQIFIAREAWQAWWKATAPTWPARRLSTQVTSTVDFYEVKDTTSDVAFVIDVSGSMADPMTLSGGYGQADSVGTKIQAAKRELWRSLRSLEPGTRVSLTWFSNTAATWGNGPVTATWRNKARLRDAFADIPPAGGTNAWAALTTALEGAGMTAIYFLTDGQPTVGENTEPAAIAAGVAEWNADRPHAARLHTVAFHIQADAGEGEAGKLRERKRREELERRAKAAGKPVQADNPAIEAAKLFLGKLSSDSGGTFREVR